MLKINLSDEEKENELEEEPVAETVVQSEPEEFAEPSDGVDAAEPESEPESELEPGTEPELEPETLAAEEPPDAAEPESESKPELAKAKASGGGRMRLLVLAALLALVAAGYMRKDMILGMFTGGDEPVQETVAPTPPPPEPEPAPESEPEPDPTFVVLNILSDAVPGRVWLTSMVVSYDGGYELKGMAFSHDAASAFLVSLGKLGKVKSSNLPKKTRTSETVYNFSVVGTLAGVSVPEILDIIPADRLAPMGGAVKPREKDYKVKFLRLPAAGAKYGENDMPFALEGSYEGLKRIVADICPVNGDTKIYRLVITPAAPGRGFDTVRASFAVRTVSSI